MSTVYAAAPVLSADSSLLILSTASPGISCFDIKGGQTAWSADTDGTNLAEPIVANVSGSSDVVVYAIQVRTVVGRRECDLFFCWLFSSYTKIR